MSELSDFQKTRQVILDLLGFVITSTKEENNPELWMLHIDNAVERIEQIYAPPQPEE